AVLGGLAIRSHQRWTRAVTALESQPGIVLTRAERGSRWRFAGLRDPLARDPSAILADVAVDSSGVEQRWEPYLSLQPEMILARAGRPRPRPASVALVWAGDPPRWGGPAPLAGVIAGGRTTPPAGVAALDVNAVAPETPADLAQLIRDIEGERVLFEIGSAA